MLPLREFIGLPLMISLTSGAMKAPFHVPQTTRFEAYAMLGGAALMMTLGMGIRQNLGLFQAPASRELGIAISDFALAISVQQVAWGVAQPFAGALADKHGTRWVALAGSLIYIVGLLLTATATSTLPIVIGAGVMIGIGLACTASGIAISPPVPQAPRAGSAVPPTHPGPPSGVRPGRRCGGVGPASRTP